MDLAIQLLSLAAAGLGIIAAYMSILCELLRRARGEPEQPKRDETAIPLRALYDALKH